MGGYNVIVNKAYMPFMSNTQRYNILMGSAGSGKSVAAAQKIVKRCIEEVGTEEIPYKHRIAVIRKFKTSVKSSVFEQIKSVLLSMGLQDYVSMNESYHNFKFWNGAEIFCTGLDEPEKIKSWIATSAWMEEMTEFEESDFKQLDLRFRGETPYYYQIIGSFNPISETHWIKNRFFDNPNVDLTYTLKTTYKDNMFIEAQYKKVLEEQYIYDENMYRIYVKGEWGRIKTNSDYYFNFKYDKHVSDKIAYTPREPLHISFDFNVNPYISATISQIVRRELENGSSFYFVNVIDEFALKNPQNTTEQLCEEIITKYEEQLHYGVFIYGDASGKIRGTRSNISDYDIIEYAFEKYMTNHSMRVNKANPMIKKRRNFINKLLYGSFNIQFRVSESCRKLIDDFQNAVEEQDGSKKKQMGKDSITGVVYEKGGHHADCNDYFLCSVFENYYDNM